MSTRHRANSFLFFLDLYKLVYAALQAGATVTRYVWEGDGEGTKAKVGEIEFEVVVTRIGGERMPRVVEKD